MDDKNNVWDDKIEMWGDIDITTTNSNYNTTIDTTTLYDNYVVYNTNGIYYTGLNHSTIITQTTEEKLNSIDIKEIEQYLRKKKLEAINKK